MLLRALVLTLTIAAAAAFTLPNVQQIRATLELAAKDADAVRGRLLARRTSGRPSRRALRAGAVRRAPRARP